MLKILITLLKEFRRAAPWTLLFFALALMQVVWSVVAGFNVLIAGIGMILAFVGFMFFTFVEAKNMDLDHD